MTEDLDHDDVDELDNSLPEGLTPEALEVAVGVIEVVATLPREQYAKRRSLRRFRRALTPLVWSLLERSYDGNMSKAAARKAHKRALNREKQRAAADERAAADRCELRRRRLARLHELQAMNDEAVGGVSSLMIADGFTEGPRSSPAITMAGEHQEPSATRAACYSCRSRFGRRELHPFYGDALCPACASLNWRKRWQTCNKLVGATALVTGGRVKIGFCVALKLLRAGANVIITSRFAADAADRYARVQDFESFKNRLEIVGCDFRDLRAVEALADYVDRSVGPVGLDILVNNACQTVRRPAAYYDAVRAKEAAALAASESDHLPVVKLLPCAPVRALLQDHDYEDEDAQRLSLPPGCVDASGQQLDTRPFNSWTMKLDQVPLAEAAECVAINALAPFSLCARLKPALKRRPCSSLMTNGSKPRFVVNVSAAEGKFARIKTVNHPHTNMAKAALNMLTRTSASDYARDQIFMNAVDTGWVNDERPLPEAKRVATDHGFQTPLDEVDGAARILDPVFSVLNGDCEPYFGFFLKDYEPTDW